MNDFDPGIEQPTPALEGLSQLLQGKEPYLFVLAIMEPLLKEGTLTPPEFKQMEQRLCAKYGISLSSILRP